MRGGLVWAGPASSSGQVEVRKLNGTSTILMNYCKTKNLTLSRPSEMFFIRYTCMCVAGVLAHPRGAPTRDLCEQSTPKQSVFYNSILRIFQSKPCVFSPCAHKCRIGAVVSNFFAICCEVVLTSCKFFGIGRAGTVVG